MIVFFLNAEHLYDRRPISFLTPYLSNVHTFYITPHLQHGPHPQVSLTCTISKMQLKRLVTNFDLFKYKTHIFHFFLLLSNYLTIKGKRHE